MEHLQQNLGGTIKFRLSQELKFLYIKKQK
jgi:hypothetical protein